MGKFNNVTIVKRANVYFNGNVTSRTVKFADGSTKTLGFMQKGEYEFNTEKPEEIEILSGSCEIILNGQSNPSLYKSGETFSVPGLSKFRIHILEPTDYICSFIG